MFGAAESCTTDCLSEFFCRILAVKKRGMNDEFVTALLGSWYIYFSAAHS